MKSLWMALGLGLLLAAPVTAQDDNESKYKAKMAEEFVSKIEWTNTLAEAQTKAKEKRMLIFGYFSRSYAP